SFDFFQNEVTSLKRSERGGRSRKDWRGYSFVYGDKRGNWMMERIEAAHDGRQLGFENEDKDL
ncbi:hypothetical protein Tco_1206359, partial [Tanacetum coccineum]